MLDKSFNLAKWAGKIVPSAMQNSLVYGNHPNFISLALGLPDQNIFPLAAIQEATQEVLKNDLTALQYTPAVNSLKNSIQQLMKLRGVDCETDEIFLTSGGQQGLSLLTRLLMNQEESIAVESFCYPGFMQAIEPFQAQIYTVQSDSTHGINLDKLTDILTENPAVKLLYLVIDGNNPLSYELSVKKRIQLAEIIKTFDITVVEDDPYGLLYFDHQSPKPLKHFSPDHVIYVGTFSKILAPALRSGWIVIPPQYQDKLAILKEGSDLNIASFSQKIIATLLMKFDLDEHIKRVRENYKIKRDVMINALRKYFDDQIQFTIPNSGLFIWINFRNPIDTRELLNIAVKKFGVAFISGESFSVKRDGSGCQSLRLNFTHPSVAQIHEGVRSLSAAYKNLASEALLERSV